MAIDSIRTYYTCVRRFLWWVHTRDRTLREIDGEGLDDYHREIMTWRLSGGATRRHRRAVRMLWAYRNVLPDHLERPPTAALVAGMGTRSPPTCRR
ncbi:hypothetical protein SGFS_003790 [Streptomyces graminofaciens]|uniref:Integrase n=1 Tax=Streptomyces graminofaciens TaxID=68212 RepID=A0ABN5V882_9ACTN|nr:hypothetical protein [Streptomyces graminofaciens]BBC29088.1 hypothetical protein SGFS_003790 [Streptomyces graminofaciens]